MTKRFLSLYDKNQSPINEGDDVQIKVKDIPEDHSFWRSNFGEFLSKHGFELVNIHFENHFPKYDFSARFSFYPLKLASEIEGNNKIEGEEFFFSRIQDTQFINYLTSSKIMEKVDATNYEADLFAPDCELNNMYYLDGSPIKANDTIVLPVNDEFYTLSCKPDWIEKFKANNVKEIHIKLSLEGFDLKTKYLKIKTNNETLKYKDVLEVPENDPFGEEDYTFGPIFHKKEYLAWYLEQAKSAKVNYFKK